MLKDKPKHWMGYFDGSLWANLESPRGFKPCDMTSDQIREINAYTHIENELIDEACAQVFGYLQKRGWDGDTGYRLHHRIMANCRGITACCSRAPTT
jgi:hypothetical protein